MIFGPILDKVALVLKLVWGVRLSMGCYQAYIIDVMVMPVVIRRKYTAAMNSQCVY